jgi:hypothetical protein
MALYGNMFFKYKCSFFTLDYLVYKSAYVLIASAPSSA